MSKFSIGVDFGTLSGRAVLVDVNTGEEVASAVYEYPHKVMDEYLPDGKTKLGIDWALQHPQDYLDVLSNTIPQVLKSANVSSEDVIGIGIDFTACTILPTDKAGKPLCFYDEFKSEPHAYVKLWKHHAAQEQANRLNEIASKRQEKFLDLYGGKISSEWLVPKVMQIAEEAPHILEDRYTLQDAIVFGGLMNTLLNNCHRIKIACLAQLVNVIAPIFTQKGGAAIRQTTFYPFKYASQYGQGQALMTISECDEFDSKFGKVKELSQSIIYDQKTDSLAVFVCNYSQDAIEAEIELRSFGDLEIIEHIVLDGADLKAINDFENPSRVTPKNVDTGIVKDAKAYINLSPLSWNMIRVKIK